MAIVYTCAKCDTRSAKTFSRHSYEQGIVLIRCPGCKKLHLIADHLGWFGDNFKIEDLADEIDIKRVDATGASAEPATLSSTDVLGWSRVEAVMALAAASKQDASLQLATGGGRGGHEEQEEEVLEVQPADLATWAKVQKQQPSE